MALRTYCTLYGQYFWKNGCWKFPSSFLKSATEIVSGKSGLSTLASFPHHKNGQLNRTSTANKSCYQLSGGNIQSHSILSRSTTVSLDNFSLSPIILPVRHYQSVLRPRLHCKGCYFVWRHGRKFVECSDIPSHKQMKKLPTRKVWLEDYSRGDVNVAMKWNRDLARIADRHVDKTVISHNWLASRLGKDI